MSDRPYPLNRERTQAIIEQMRLKISKGGAGITVVEDHNGAWGKAGQTHVAVRFYMPGEKQLCSVGMVIENVADHEHDRLCHAEETAPPQ